MSGVIPCPCFTVGAPPRATAVQVTFSPVFAVIGATEQVAVKGVQFVVVKEPKYWSMMVGGGSVEPLHPNSVGSLQYDGASYQYFTLYEYDVLLVAPFHVTDQFVQG